MAKEKEQINLKILRIKIDRKIKMRNILTLKQYLKKEQQGKQYFREIFKYNRLNNNKG